MNKYLIIFFCSCVFYIMGCNQPESPVIEQEKIVNILVDVHMIEASLLGYSEEQKDTLTQLYYSQVYEIHSVSEEDFKAEMDFLKRNPDEMKEVYEKVLEEIDKREAELK